MDDPKPKARYNPGNGNRLDLYVFDEPEAVSRERWGAARRAYLATLVDDPGTSAFARSIYWRELQNLDATK